MKASPSPARPHQTGVANLFLMPPAVRSSLSPHAASHNTNILIDPQRYKQAEISSQATLREQPVVTRDLLNILLSVCVLLLFTDPLFQSGWGRSKHQTVFTQCIRAALCSLTLLIVS